RTLTLAGPRAQVQTLSDVPVNQRVWIEEGSDRLRAEKFPAVSIPALPGRVATETVSQRKGTWLYQPFAAPDFTLRDVQGNEHSLSGLTGHAVLLYFCAVAAPPSCTGLQGIGRQRDVLAARGVSILGVPVGQQGDAPHVT